MNKALQGLYRQSLLRAVADLMMILWRYKIKK